jgi:polyisoprenoid-binding protein YceI
MTAMAGLTLPDLTPGTWTIDTAHTEIGFTVRHMMVSKVRGRFTKFSGQLEVAEDALKSKVTAEIDADSINTNEPTRDNHLRTADFFEVEKHPTWTFTTTSITPVGGGEYTLTGDLTIKGVTRPVELSLEFNGVVKDPYGMQRAGFTATTTISRDDFGVDIKMPMDGGGVVISDKIQINLDVEAVLQS